ncbi:hypothetical protein [Ligilactobacillus salivarius]|uniref:hypothetical protein n=1 Tax=Ligilactobacillus salivarius TaxID=1624 RepID=UPI001958CE5F|nr:hypothetical protein [Ligilactobacillus salivarius]MBM6787297.1 hypothetical protein [Ligilactobacillus salivarius]
MEKLKRQIYHDTSPIIKVYLTDAQFQELKQDLLDDFKDDLIREIARDEIEKYDLKAPYLKQKDFAKWIGESIATVNELRAKGLPVSKALNTDRYGKQSYIDFMKQYER